MSTLLKSLLLSLLVLLAGCGDDVEDADKYTKPTVDAGSDKVYTLPQNTLTLSGSAKTYPKNVFSIKETKWTQTSGPTQLAILNADSLTATLLNPTTTGAYTFELYAKDSGGRTNTDSVKIVLTQSVQVASARSSAGYRDDFNLMWDTVAEDESRYPLIEDQWQQNYQPYLVEAEKIKSDEQWQTLVTKMINDLNASHMELQVDDKKVLDNAVGTGGLVWTESNGIGEIQFDRLAALSSQELLLQLSNALNALSTNSDIYLDFGSSGYFDDQLLLTLIARLTGDTQKVCVIGFEHEKDCVELQSHADIQSTQFIVKGTEGNKQALQLAAYLESQQQGDEVFLFEPNLPLTSGLVLN